MMSVERKLNNFVYDINKCIDNELYHAALSMTLMLPDICSKLVSPDKYTEERYKEWFEKYVGFKYIGEIGPGKTKKVFLSKNDAYALRCAFLHQGETDISKQRAREILHDFQFITPPRMGTIHCNEIDSRLQLQVDRFCKDFISGVNVWLKDVNENSVVNNRASNMITIEDWSK